MRSTTTAASTRSARCFGKSLPRLGHADLVAGAPDALEAGAHRAGRLDLHDEVDGAHVDPELEARRAHEAAQPPRLELVLDLEPALTRQRAVVGLDELDTGRRRAGLLAATLQARRRLDLGGELVESGGEALGEAAGVHEQQRRAMRLDELEQPRDGPTARSTGAPVRRRPGPLTGSSTNWPRLPMSSMGTTTSMSRALRTPASTIVTGRGRAALEPAEEAGDLLERALRGREADPLRGGVAGRRDEMLEPLEADRQVGAALGGGEGVDLVDDDGLDAAQRLARLRREHQVERLGRRDEEVGRAADEEAALLGRGVAGADADGRLVHGLAEALGGEADAGERRPQVLVDVDGEGPQRGDVEQAGAGLPRRRATGSVMRRSMPHRKAARVLPEPVGARIRACWPAAMAGQPWAWGAVGAPKVVSNQVRTGAENGDSGMARTVLPACRDTHCRGSGAVACR